jgi:plastocyanin
MIMLAILLVSAAIIASPLLLSNNVAYAQHVSGLAGTTFPPPVFYTIRGQPSYEISIPFGAGERTMFEPHYVNIPVGMTIIWFNNDDGEHSVSTLTNSTYSPPETINSGTISADGGSFIHQFNTPGRYVYFDQFDPSMHGVINVGSAIEIGKYFNMHIGGINTMPFNPGKLRSVVLSFVPKTVTFPPLNDIVYNITLLNSTGKALYSHTYLDSDGILDLELIPAHKLPLSKNSTSASTAQQFTTWGPDFIGQDPVHTTGTFHISGPMLIQKSPYSIQVSIIGKDNTIFPSPVSETFALP